MQGMQVQSPVGELRSLGVAKNFFVNTLVLQTILRDGQTKAPTLMMVTHLDEEVAT